MREKNHILRAFRGDRTQAEMAKFFYVSVRTYIRWEMGDTTPPGFIMAIVQQGSRELTATGNPATG